MHWSVLPRGSKSVQSPAKKRVPTRKSKAVRNREIEEKKKRGQMKKMRGKVSDQ
jgi:hypothetical protein